MAQDNTLARSLHDLGLATWFGGSLMGAVSLNGAAAVVDAPEQRLRVANTGWARWTPVNLAGIAAHLAGGAVLLAGKGRLATQRGVAGATVAKAAVTGLALGATAYSRALGERLMQAGDAPVEGGTTPSDATPNDLASSVAFGGVTGLRVAGRSATAGSESSVLRFQPEEHHDDRRGQDERPGTGGQGAGRRARRRAGPGRGLAC
jgi:hypothetical protein